jgi:hypothetical protein
MTARFASGRERASARRVWLGEALERFYGPVSAKMEMWYEWNKRLWDEQQAKLKDQGEIRYTDTEMAVLRKAVQANIKVHQEVRAIVEQSLHYVDEPDLRKRALGFLTDSYMDDWRRAAGGMDDTLADDRGLILVTESERTPFLNLVVERFEAKASEFQALAGGGSSTSKALPESGDSASNTKVP